MVMVFVIVMVALDVKKDWNTVLQLRERRWLF